MLDTEVREFKARLQAALGDRYELREVLGIGGMAVVFLAHDVKHERLVALKALKPELSAGLGNVRFLGEIKTTAALVHPHVLSLIDSGEAGGSLYYVMPYLTGESLRQKLEREGRLSLDEALEITRDVSAALEYAHRQGVMHRDIKPENILLHEGEAVVADFGIALALRAAGGERLTGSGITVGTPQYMSPEQAAGEGDTDARSDLYSLAVVLYEMLAGEPPHTGPNASAVLAKIVSQHPAPISTVRDVPERIDTAIARSLAKAPIDRFPSCAAFAEALLTGEVRISTPTSTSRVGTRKRVGILAASVSAAVVAGFLIFQLGGSTDAARIAPVTSQITFTGGSEAVALAPDGQMVAYLTDESRTLVVQDIHGGSEVRVVESETPMGRPRFSPDGATILFSGHQNGEFGLYTVSRLGGDPQLAVSIDLPFPEGTGGRGLRPPMRGAGTGPRAGFPGLFEAYDFAGSADRVALACCLGRLVSTPLPSRLRLSSPDSLSAPDEAFVTTLGESVERVLDLSVSPDGNWISILAQTRARETTLGIISAGGGELRTLATTDSISGLGAPLGAVRWPSPGRHVFYLQQAGQATNLLALPIDPRRGTSEGEPVLVRSGLPLDVSFDISLSTDRLVYTGGPQREHLVRVDIGAEPETPIVQRITQGTWHHHSPAISPSGEWVAYAKGTGTEWDVYRRSLIDGSEARITRTGLPITSLSWSPDGARLAVVGGAADPKLSVLDVATGRVIRVAAARPFPNTRPIWSPDGANVLFATPGDSRPPDPSRARQIQRGMSWMAWDVETGVETRVDVGGARRVISPVFAPDGRSIAVFGAFERNAGAPGLYILPLSTSEPRQLVDGSTLPLAWAEDGTIFLVRDNSREAGLTRIERVGAAQGGEPDLHAVLPFECSPQNLTLAPDGRVAVCAVAETESDVWVTEHVNTGLR